jgi:hypothetical protein
MATCRSPFSFHVGGWFLFLHRLRVMGQFRKRHSLGYPSRIVFCQRRVTKEGKSGTSVAKVPKWSEDTQLNHQILT